MLKSNYLLAKESFTLKKTDTFCIPVLSCNVVQRLCWAHNRLYSMGMPRFILSLHLLSSHVIMVLSEFSRHLALVNHTGRELDALGLRNVNMLLYNILLYEYIVLLMKSPPFTVRTGLGSLVVRPMDRQGPNWGYCHDKSKKGVAVIKGHWNRSTERFQFSDWIVALTESVKARHG